jgi:acetyl-CoA synthetase
MTKPNPARRGRLDLSWSAVERELTEDGRLDLNMGRIAVDRWGQGEPGRPALRFLDRDLRATELTYGDLQGLTNRFASVLRRLGAGRGDVVASLLGPCPALYAAALGALKGLCVYCPLFTAFGPEPLRRRLGHAKARVLVTTAALYRRKLEALRAELPHLEHVLLTDSDRDPPPGCLSLDRLLADADPGYEPLPPADRTPALLHFTSGTTGQPKGAMHAHQAILAQYATSRLVLDLGPGERYWCTANPGWVTGTVYAILGPLSTGATVIVDMEPFDAHRWYRILEQEGVTVWYTAPTAIRMLMRAGEAVAADYDLSALRLAASVGEPLNPEAVTWGQRVFGRPFLDTWWQTETGAIMIANRPGMAVRPGSMGRPLPGIEATVLDVGDGRAAPVDAASQPGELALRRGWPSMFDAYLDEPDRYARRFRDGWYLTGDLARRDADGYFWFVGRGDDLIKSSGHLIGPFEVENVLMEHPGVAEAGVVGKPDPIAGEVVKAFVSLKPGFLPGEALRRELLAHARRRLGPAVAPREIAFREQLPKTHSGKILRRLLKDREAGGDSGEPPGSAQGAPTADPPSA